MGKTTTRTPMMSHRVLSPNHDYHTGDHHPHDQPMLQLSGSIFGFLEEEVNGAAVLSSPMYGIQHAIEDETENPQDIDEHKIQFWETQCQTLHTTLFRTTSLESKIRSITKQVLEEIEMAANVCSCSIPVVASGCRSCKMREICSRLQNSGYNSAICKSKWKSSLEIPSGEHTFVDVIDNTNPKKGEVRVIIELELRGQFEMKKGSQEYNNLVQKLPEVFVGKLDRLQFIVKIVTNAAKKCMKEKKMHLGPWRKQEYMQAKWLRATDERTPAMTTTAIKPLAAVVDGYYLTRPAAAAKVKASMLTMDLLDNMPSNMSYLYAHTVQVL